MPRRLRRLNVPTVLRFLRTPGLARSLTALLAFAILLLAVANVSTFMMIERTAAIYGEVDETWRVRRSGRLLFIDLRDAESSQRGYLLTGQTVLYRTYQEQKAQSLEHFETLRQQVRGDDLGEAIAEALDPRIADKLAEMDRAIEAAREGRTDVALGIVRTGEGQRLMDEIRTELDRLDALQGVRVQARTDASRASSIATLTINGLAGMLILVLAGMVAFLLRRHIGALTRAQQDLDALNAGLEQTIRDRTGALTRANEEVQRFAYIVSHDLRSPLVNVMGFTSELEAAGQVLDRQVTRLEAEAPQLLDRDAVLAVREDLPEAVNFIRASTGKMDRLIGAILQLSREGRRNLVAEPLDMTAMTRGIADSVRHQIAATDGEIVVADLPSFESDRLSIEQIIGNLIDNAVKYLEPGRPGRIEITGQDVAGGWVTFAIADNGRGIAPRDHERIFELFRRAGRQDVQGEGLGLAFVRNSVRRLGGEITLESELGKGSTFHLKFPKRLVLEDAGETL